jgi:hypothetical protein
MSINISNDSIILYVSIVIILQTIKATRIIIVIKTHLNQKTLLIMLKLIFLLMNQLNKVN